jgi:hypothetical protein
LAGGKNAWHNTHPQVISGKEPSTGETAVGLRNIEGRASLAVYHNLSCRIQPEKTYSSAFKISTATPSLFLLPTQGCESQTDVRRKPNSLSTTGEPVEAI